MDQLALLHRLMVLMMGRYPHRAVDAAFIFGRAQRDYEGTEGDTGILETAAHLYHGSMAQYLTFPGTKGYRTTEGDLVVTTYPGPEVFSAQLCKLGVPANRIIPTEEAPSHTRGDSDAFVKLAKARGWSRAAVIMHPHQMLRAMLSILKSFELHDHAMTVVPVCPRTVNWNKDVYGSQGALLLKRHRHIAQEWVRIPRYQAQGALASLEELETYLNASLVQ